MTDRNKPPQPSSTKLPRDAKGRLILGDKPAARWLDETCDAKTGDLTVCGLRRFMTVSGETCPAGHGGAPKRVMTRREIATWIRRFEDGELELEEMPDDFPELRAGDGRGKMPHQIIDDEIAASKERLCPEIGGPHNYQHIDQADDDSPLYCVDCDHRPDYKMKVAKEVKQHHFGPGDLTRGDVVTLISGGPPMTVLNATGSTTKPALSQDYTVECVWFTRDYKLERSTFHIETLRPPRLRPTER